MLHVWLIPALLCLAALVGLFYVAMRVKGGSGVRTHGRTVHDQPGEEDNPPPS